MKWRALLKRFGLRFAISLVVLGAVYLATFGLHPGSPKLTPTAKIVALRTALDQTLINSSRLANFKQNDAVSYSVMNDLAAQLAASTKNLDDRLDQAPKDVSPALRAKITEVIARQQQANKDFNSRYNVLSRSIAYDPAIDLGQLDPGKEPSKLAQRASAARDGLKKATDGTTNTGSTGLNVTNASQDDQLVSAEAREALLKESKCLAKLVDQINANQPDQATQTRISCIRDYPAIRAKVIQNVIQGSLPTSYQQYLKTDVLPLLKQLDDLAD
jgi:hypothetical protein